MKTRYLTLGLLLIAACDEAAPQASTADKITARSQLIGGPGALGDIGDYLLSNGKVRVIVQSEGFSRGFGIYGGGIIDADLQRAGGEGDSRGGTGFDNFSELFPALFLRAAAPSPNGIKTEEFPDGSAQITVTGRTDEFLFMLNTLNDVVLGEEPLIFRNEFHLAPGKRYVRIRTTITNPDTQTVEFPGPGIDALTGGVPLVIPVGDILLYGAGNRVFIPKAGFDVRFTLEDIYTEPTDLPALPSLLTPFIASAGPNVSYGFTNGFVAPESSFVGQAAAAITTSTSAPGNQAYLDGAGDDLAVPFLFSAFTGAFASAAPKELRSRESFTYERYFIIGRGDVASIRDIVHDIKRDQCSEICTDMADCLTACRQKWATGKFGGRVRDEMNLEALSDISVMTFRKYDDLGRLLPEPEPYNQHTPDSNGMFTGTYQPGEYTYRLVGDGRFTTDHVGFEVIEGQSTFVQPLFPSPGFLTVRVKDEKGRLLPSRCVVVGTYDNMFSGQDPMDFLHDLSVGEPRRPTDLIDDTADASTRQFIETEVFLANGTGRRPVRPGTYRAVCTRGPEYELAEQDIEIKAGETLSLDFTLPRAFTTEGWIAGDFHLHAINSVDSFMDLESRVVAAAAEGLDLAVATDHNFVTDYTPTISDLGLDLWMQGMVGLELTTLEVGHFNGFPLRYDPGPITKGSFEWSGRPPGELFADLRARGAISPEDTIIQCNHPRDTILGYFNNYLWNQDTGEPQKNSSLILAPDGPEFGPENFDTGFDAIEVYNGKRFELLRNYRVPDPLPPPPLPMDIPPAGTILRDGGGEIAFPGGVDDWYAMLDLGLRKTAMGNSDSHNTEDETGYPRTYVKVSNDNPGEIPEIDVVRAIQGMQAVATNGPFIDVKIGDKGIGETADATSGMVTLDIQIKAASWVPIDQVNIVLNGEVVDTIRGDYESLSVISATVSVTRDSWVLVEATGSKSMWPVITPHEIPSVQIADAVGSLAGAFGLDLNPYGNLRPDETFIVTPLGFTNPIFLDEDGNGTFEAPGARQRALRASAAKTEPRADVQRFDPNTLPRLLRLFSAFSHGHE